MHDMTKMQNEGKPNHGGNIISQCRKWQELDYKYGKLHPGCYNTPPLREDLVPRSRTERTPDTRNVGGPRAPRWLLGLNGVTISLSGILLTCCESCAQFLQE